MKHTFDEHALSFQQIKFESELDRQFGRQISAMAYGENLFGCIQCGTCSGTCPMSSYMDFTPRKIIAMVRAGFREEVLTNKTVWLCASCYSCTVECPKGIRITDVMYALKREAMITGLSPRQFSIPVLATTFSSQVRRHGRLNEVLLMASYYLSTHPLKAISQLPRAFKLLRTGRLRLFERGITEHKALERILAAVEANPEATV